MILRCRTCGKGNTVENEARELQCDFCGARTSLKVAKVIEREAPKPSDPLAEFR